MDSIVPKTMRRAHNKRAEAVAAEVLAVPRNESLWDGTDLWRVDAVHATYGDREWHRMIVGLDSKGERWYDWQCWILAEPEDAD